MKTNNKQKNESLAQEPEFSYLKTFTSQEDAALYNLKKYMALNDTEKFNLFCDMLHLEQLYKTARISDYTPSK
ncbi:MAG: hypothetical protein HZA79_01045 [Sphingobacteriales bacterium]|nr:hypothetical protein [Sphingobacteriales bacterium]